ncbi:MAG: rod shape-determining protein RodA [Clostridia bacterium]|nr:rod shape-determining protein RodA [Clostridia bacterium]
MKKTRNFKYTDMDFVLIALSLVCAVFGLVMISSAVNSMDGGSNYIIIQTVAMVLGIIMMLILTTIDYENLGNITKIIYIGCILLLVAVLVVGTGREDVGSKSWIRFGPIGIQPSEFVKIGFIITFSKHAASVKDEINRPKNIFLLCLHLLIILGLIMLQPDFGTAMVFTVIFIGIMFVSGISYKYILTAVGAIVAAVPLAWNFFLQDYQKNRILVFLNPESDPLGSGYHVIQSKIAIGSGQIFGKGLYQGTQTQLGYLPVKHTDFIYAVVGEELGLIGCVIVAALLFAIVFRCIYNSKVAKNDFSSNICIGVACMFMAHIFENIGMCVGLMPVTGIPLPFFSYGGSSLITNFVAIGLVLSTYMRRREITFDNG